jgi:hypothetical protein
MDIPMEQAAPIMRRNLLALARVYAKHRGIKLSTLSRHIRGDMYFLEDYAKKKIGVTDRKYDEIRQWFYGNWPTGLPFPKMREYK